MDNPVDLSGRVAIVTGGGKGVGRGISEVLLSAGAEVVICGRNAPDTLPTGGGRSAFFTPCDVREIEQIQACIEVAATQFGRLDILVNNAGGAPYAEAATASPRFSEAIIRLNLIAPLNFAQAANAVMQTQDSGGSIINIASVSTIRPSPGTAAYGAAKAGLVNLGTSLAVEWAPRVRVNSIICGLTITEQSHLHYGDEAGVKAVGKTIPLGRMAIPTDIGNACLFLASPLSSYISGASLAVHGGGELPTFLEAANVEQEGSH
jgi:NAD(P)-dependent dehydrogenase (short-subunit alcohol dehydrogenase family)